MQNSPRFKNLAYAGLAAQSGCFTLTIVFAALLIGLFIDAQLNLRGPFTIGLLILSIPISLFVMVRLALGAIRQIQPSDAQRDKSQKQEVDR